MNRLRESLPGRIAVSPPPRTSKDAHEDRVSSGVSVGRPIPSSTLKSRRIELKSHADDASYLSPLKVLLRLSRRELGERLFPMVVNC